MKSLNLENLRYVNDHRKCEPEAYKACASWTLSDWMLALVGEVGELANYLKKENRDVEADYEEDIAKEFADVLIYLDILASERGINLSEAVISKFNEKSREIGSQYFLEED